MCTWDIIKTEASIDTGAYEYAYGEKGISIDT